MNFTPNKTPVEIISEGAFRGMYFRDIYSRVNGKWYRNSWKEFDFLKDTDPKLYSSNYYDVSVKYIRCKMWYIFAILGKLKDALKILIRMVGFSGTVDII